MIYKRLIMFGLLMGLVFQAGLLFGGKPIAKGSDDHYKMAYDDHTVDYGKGSSRVFNNYCTDALVRIDFEYFTAVSNGDTRRLTVHGVIYRLNNAGKPKIVSRDGFSFWSPVIEPPDDCIDKIPADLYGKDKTYDVGHLVPARDMAFNRGAMQDTFCYFNTVPMVPELNRGPWCELEESISKYAAANPDVCITVVAGASYIIQPYGAPPLELAQRKLVSADGKVTIKVPAYCYKIVFLSMHPNSKRCFSNGSSFAVMAYKMPNTKDVRGGKPSDFLVPLKELYRDYPKIIQNIPWVYMPDEENKPPKLW